MEDNLWLITSALLVFVMQAGFLCLESGRIRSKNSINVAAKNIADFALAVVTFWMIGFGLMFGSSVSGLFGTTQFFFDSHNSMWVISFFIFQLMFCGTATTIMSGAVAERMSFNGYLISALILSALIYPISGHWAWGNLVDENNLGWLQSLGFIDFAGSMVVHGVGGSVSLVAIMIIGHRKGRFDSGVNLPQGSNLPFAALGTLLIWFGWFGFNGGSSLAFDSSVPVVLMNTTIAAAWGGIAASSIHYLRHRYFDVTMILNGVIGGLVGITAGCFAVSSEAAAMIGIISGLVVYFGEEFIYKMRLDDALGVIPAHWFCGIWGVLSVGVYGDLDTLGTGLSRLEQIGVQLLGATAISAWSISVAWVSLTLINRFIPLRVDAEAEEMGMNVSEHKSATELLDLLLSMKRQQDAGDFSSPVPEEPFTEVGVVARQYNQVIERVQHEIHARDNAIESFQASERRKSAILDSSMDCIVTIDNHGNILEFNPSAERTFDFLKSRVEGQSFIDVIVPTEHRDYVRNSLQHGFSTHDGLLLNRRNSLALIRKGGDEFPAEISITSSRLNENNHGEYVLNIRDVTRQKRLQAKLRQLAYSDPLTGLYNRTYLIENLRKQLFNINQLNETLVVYFLDLDKFKRINDTLGHKAGDGLLCEVANRLSLVTREADVITRWGGDEFIILMQGRLTKEFARQKANEILEVMRKPVDLEGYSLNIPTSVGINVVHPSEAIDADKVIQCADIAMYQAKVQGRDNYQFFEESMAHNTNKHFKYERDLREDLDSERFSLVFQPKVDRNQQVVGLEVLSRWRHAEDGVISPTEFIAVAEESNLIIDLGERVLKSSILQLRHWLDKDISPVPVAVNISGRQLLSPTFIPFLRGQLAAHKIDGALLEIEITESVLVADVERCIDVMKELKGLGITISVDDFGTGYSSLNYLKRLPLDILKIDKSFVDDCHSVNEDAKICSTIINLAKNLDLVTIAEGVEHAQQVDFLMGHGCQQFQGYYFYKPMSVDQIEPLLVDRKQHHYA